MDLINPAETIRIAIEKHDLCLHALGDPCCIPTNIACA
jgi:hypothetical protein